MIGIGVGVGVPAALVVMLVIVVVILVSNEPHGYYSGVRGELGGGFGKR